MTFFGRQWRIFRQVLCTLVLVAGHCGIGAGASAPEGFDRANGYLRDGAYAAAIHEYDRLYVNHPDPMVKAKSLFFSATTYAGYLKRYPEALRLLDRLIEWYSDSPYAEDALFAGGTILFRKGDFQRADRIFSYYLKRYPQGHHADGAVEWLESIRKKRSLPVEDRRPLARLPSDIRVQLFDGVARARVRAPGGLQVRRPGAAWQAVKKRRVTLRAAASRVVSNIPDMQGQRIELKGTDGRIEISGRMYRGVLQCIGTGGRLQVVNRLSLESYLYGVISSEMPRTWPVHALKAQAVAARTYAVYMSLKNANLPADVTNCSGSQMYGGIASETAAARMAVNATRGQVMTYDGYPVIAYFHADSGGHTEDGVNVWGPPALPYLKGKADPAGRIAGIGPWTVHIPLKQMETDLRQAGVHIRGLREVSVVRRSPSGRMTELELTGSRSRVRVNGNRFRLAVGGKTLKSLKCNVTIDGHTACFRGTGFGHGVGMSQWGAKHLAENGHTYTDILHAYYPGVRIRTY